MEFAALMGSLSCDVYLLGFRVLGGNIRAGECRWRLGAVLGEIFIFFVRSGPSEEVAIYDESCYDTPSDSHG